MEIDYINGIRSTKMFGRSKYQREIVKRISEAELNIIEYDPTATIIKKMLKMDDDLNSKDNTPISKGSSTTKAEPGKITSLLLNTAASTMDRLDRYRYKHEIMREINEGNIKHITSQELAYALKSLKNYKTVLTCYDLIPWVYDNDRSVLWQENMKWMPTADRIITISEFSRDEIIKNLNFPIERIDIVYPAVDHDIYRPINGKEILKQFNISYKDKVVLYVGSETPRQNVQVLIRAFLGLKKMIPNIKLVKIGESQSTQGRDDILKLIHKHDLKDHVIFTGYVPEEDMPQWYNAADLLVYPCDYAGFGLPPLEAMACGTPVITSNTSSLPEVVGTAGIMIDPHDDELMADKMYQVLNSDNLSNKMTKKGLEMAELFNWEKSAQKTLEVYRSMENGR